ncbi:Mediator of RNA polymerase II transcription subunit 16 [Exophiala xenobiotica]|nr:Mediator of RNA polymerase II transcription subunit 16 [Exophiala xenobiotica]
MEQLDQLKQDQLGQTDDFASEAFFDQNTLEQQIQQLDPTNGLNAAANVGPPPDPTIIENLQRRWFCGYLERVAWSRLGHIATISDDSSKVRVGCLRFSCESKSWELYEQVTLPTLFEDAVGLLFSGHGLELAIVDAKGRLCIYHCFHLALNRFMLGKPNSLDEVHDSSQIIGMAWLNQDRQERPRNVVTHATKNDTRWLHTNSRAKPLGPFFARGLVVVHRSGTVAFWYQRNDGQYVRSTGHLSTTNDMLYSHASLTLTADQKMMIAVHSLEGEISICYMSIDWNPNNLPALSFEFVPTKVSAQPPGSATMPELYDPDSWRLSHLELMHSSEVEKEPSAQPAVVAILTGINKVANIGDPGYLAGSMIKKWTLTSVEQKLHPLFESLPTKGSGRTGPVPVLTLQGQLEKAEQPIVTGHHVDGLQAFVVTTTENRTDFLSSDDFSSVSYAASITETASMAQSGFTYPYTNIYCPAFSINACLRADVGNDDKTQIAAMEFQVQGPTQQPLDPHLDAAIAALNLAFARACWSNASIDDVLMCALHTIPHDTLPSVVMAMYRTLFRDTEFINEKTQGSELERIFHKQVMGRVMAYHALLVAYCPNLTSITTTDGRVGCWSLSAQWAWVASNIRHTATLLFMNLRDVQHANLTVSQDYTDMLCLNIRWGLAVIRWIISAILEVSDRETNPEMFDSKAGRLGDAKGDGSQGLVALVLNIHCSRVFLVAFIRAVRAYAKNAEPKTRHQLQVLQTIQQHTTGKGITFQAIEAILEFRWAAVGDVDGDIAATTVRQLEMMATGVVPEAYQGTIKLLLTKLFNSQAGLRAKMLLDRLKLFTDRVDLDYVFLNHDVLGRLPDDVKGRRVIYDVHRKRPILKGVLEPGSDEPIVRRCLRCGSFSADIVVPPPDWLSKTVGSLLTKCVCDGNWVIEPWKKYSGES